MAINLSRVEAVLQGGLDRAFPAAQVEIRLRNRAIFSSACGWVDPETRQEPVAPDSLFDLASLTKLFTVAAFMTLVEEGALRPDHQPTRLRPHRLYRHVAVGRSGARTRRGLSDEPGVLWT